MAFILGTAKYIPEKIVTNEDLVQFPEKYRNMIRDKAGILQRRHVTDECTSDIGAKAVENLLRKTNLNAGDIDALICATSSPDRIQPATATRIQQLCGLEKAFAFDINSVCSGGMYAVKIASALVDNGLKNVIVVAAEVYSKILNSEDISTFPYFGDGAAAVLVSNEGTYEINDFILGSDGEGCNVIQVPAGGTMLPAPQVTRAKDYYFSMSGSKVFKFALEKGSSLVKQLMERNSVTPDKVILHQANINIINNIAEITEIDREKFFVNVHKYGNTAGASVLIAMDEYLEEEQGAENLILAAFGGGLSWAGCYLKKV